MILQVTAEPSPGEFDCTSFRSRLSFHTITTPCLSVDPESSPPVPWLDGFLNVVVFEGRLKERVEGEKVEMGLDR